MVIFQTKKRIKKKEKEVIHKIVQNWGNVIFSDEKKSTGVNAVFDKNDTNTWTCYMTVKQGRKKFFKDHATVGIGENPIKAALKAIDNFTNAYVIKIGEQMAS